MPELTPSDLDRAARLVVDQLRPLAGDWAIPVPGLRWDARRVADHMVGVAFGYALALALARHPLPSPPRLRRHDPDLSAADLVELLDGGCRLLVLAAAAVDPSARLDHPTGRPDREGYIAMGCDELLIHAADVAFACGATLDVPDDLAAKVVARLFPWAPTGHGGWATLLWANGRGSLPGVADASPRWRWHAEPLAEWDGVTVPLWPERA